MKRQRLQLWFLWLCIKRTAREQLQPDAAADWVQVFGLLLSLALMGLEFLNFFWWLARVFGAR